MRKTLLLALLAVLTLSGRPIAAPGGIDAALGSNVAVTSGLTKGERIVSVGGQSLLSESHKGEIPFDSDDKPKKEK